MDALRTAYKREVEILSEFKNLPNLVNMVDYTEHEKKDGTEVFILLQYCPNGNLFDLIEEKCKIGLNGISDEYELFKVINDIANGLRVLHSKKVAHRDIKIENVLKGDDQNWKICDFGSCSRIEYGSELSPDAVELIKTDIEKNTTPIYRAPEQLDFHRKLPIGTKVDIWALGCVMFTLMFHRPPFDDCSKLAQMSAAYKIPDNHGYSAFAVDLIQRMLSLNPDDRPSAQQVFDETLSLSGNGNKPGYNLKFQFNQDVLQSQFRSIVAGEELDLSCYTQAENT